MTVPADSSRKLRILCLHGYLQSADSFRMRIGSMRKALKSRAEFFFVDAPYLATEISDKDPADAATEAAECSGSASQGRTWWQWSDTEPGTRPSRAAQYTGWEASQSAIQEALELHWPIDGLLGFSQGATAAALWMAHAQKHALVQVGTQTSGNTLDKMTQLPQQRMPRWTVHIGGFYPLDKNYAAILSESQSGGGGGGAGDALFPFPSLHVTGSKDTLVYRERSAALWDCFCEEHRVVYEHPGAHMVPTCSGEFKQVVVQFLDTAGRAASGGGGGAVV